MFRQAIPFLLAAVAAAPTLTSLNYTVGDIAGGGQSIVATGTNCATVTAVNIWGSTVAPSATTATTVTFTLPAHAAGTTTVSLTGPGGTSSTLAFESWYPGTDASCTLLVEKSSYVAGTWTARIGGNFTGAGANPTASGGEPVFVNTGYLVSAANISALVGAGVGAIFSVQAPTTESNPEQSPPYNNISIWSKQSSGPMGLWNATNGATQWYGFSLFDGTSYLSVRSNVTGLTTGRHATVGTFNSSRMRLSVNGSALASASLATTGSPLSFPAFPINLGADYTGANGFSGSMRVFAAFNIEADDALATRCYQWARQRHGIA